MKILYISSGDHMDYQSDCLLIGLKELYGPEIVDVNGHPYLYESFPETAVPQLYGKGMTIARVLPNDAVDRSDIAPKIESQYFDLIVYGSIWRCQDYLDLVLSVYPCERVAFVDGEDEPYLHPLAGLPVPYFKRELMIWSRPGGGVESIGFAIPSHKTSFDTPKTRDLAICDPRDRSTYIYDTEADYYHGYAESRYAVTVKKAGWDCMRHYEILANGCLPLFLDVGGCPPATMTHFPKDACLELLQRPLTPETYDEYAPRFAEHTQRHLTTTALAKRFLMTLTPEAT
ncbi:MAG: hypothetical protein IPI32_08515 [Austwickia sp.]|jgi:hypothetical protein|nr:hypothetical protein [Austwickia sp.]MBK8436476.1 hypothetical protein [Austwickia sp.]MBK9102153.1 hypothetical protein [Austwickia sp.]